jgi:hypothetical protein
MLDSENVVLNGRKAVTVLGEEAAALTFIKPFSGGYENHLFVIHEDAYGDSVSGLMHKNNIIETYQINEKIIEKIFKCLKNGN